MRILLTTNLILNVELALTEETDELLYELTTNTSL